ncbi:MAG: class I SAM-dependent methyltransferase [Acidobacteriota bacterium]
METKYIHGTDACEQQRLAALNQITNSSFIDFLELTGHEIVLEVGSGLGILSSAIAARLPRGRVVGLEYATAQLVAAQINAAANLNFCQADAHNIPLLNDSFDLVYCRYLLEHVGNPIQVLEEIRRVLKPGGRIYIQENNIAVNTLYPDCSHFNIVWQKFILLQKKLGGDPLIGKKLFALLQGTGFRNIELSLEPELHWSGQPSFRPWVENLIGNLKSSINDLIKYRLSSEEEIMFAINELTAFMQRNDATALFYWNRAKALQ